ncbi:hydroxyectoine utilization dehydratase EutB [Halobacillus fulvus]|nr:hydroxyectoine utilization dehydratase EutB [Halobacillus fulvus]
MTDSFFPFRDIYKAKHRISSIVEPTPLIYSEPLSDLLQTDVYLKYEQEHPTGAFKIRGAANKVLSLSEEDRDKGVTTFSTGNHGISVAYIANRLDISCTVCISNRVPSQKRRKLERLGAQVIVTGNSQDDAKDYCERLERESGMTIIPPFDDPDIIAGQGTIGLELIEQCPDLKKVIIPLSGGGLLAGIGYALKSIDASIQIKGVTMEKSAVMYESLKNGTPLLLEETETLADSLLGGIGLDNRYTFPMTKAFIDQAELVSEASIANGIYYMMDHHKMIVEGAAAAGIGCLLNNQETGPVVAIITGNNIDSEVIDKLVKER